MASTSHPVLPAYGKVKAFIKKRISAGTWKPGDPVPSESVLMVQFGVSRMTVNRALRELMGEGLVTRVQGSGTFVAELHRISSTLSIRDIHEEVVERGHIHTARVLLATLEKASADLARTLGFSSGGRVFHTILIHLENGVPTSLGNLDFDADLRQSDQSWGIRPLDAVVQQAALAGLELQERVAMPANNLLLVFSFSASPPPAP